MRFKTITVLALVLAFALASLLVDAIPLGLLLAGVLAPTFIYSRLNPPSSDIKNLREFLDTTFDGKILEYHLNDVTKPGDNSISKIRGLEVKLLKSNGSNEVT